MTFIDNFQQKISEFCILSVKASLGQKNRGRKTEQDNSARVLRLKTHPK